MGDIFYIDLRERERLSKCWSQYPGRDWVNGYLDLVKKLLDRAGLGSEDERLVMSIRGNGTLPVTINQRYVLWAKKPDQIGLIVPIAYDPGANVTRERILKHDYFYAFQEKNARWVLLERPGGVQLSPEMKQLWLEAALCEVEAGKKSSFRKYHRPAFYQAVKDRQIREMLLNDAFPEKA